jgi:hypothetical protein
MYTAENKSDVKGNDLTVSVDEEQIGTWAATFAR